MRKTTVCLTAALLILCAAALCVTSCSPTTNEPCGEPVNLIAEGLMKQSPTIYLSAFEGKYINGLRDYYDTFSEDDLDSLSTAKPKRSKRPLYTINKLAFRGWRDSSS